MEKYIKTKSVIMIVFRPAENAVLALTAHHCQKPMKPKLNCVGTGREANRRE